MRPGERSQLVAILRGGVFLVSVAVAAVACSGVLLRFNVLMELFPYYRCVLVVL